MVRIMTDSSATMTIAEGLEQGIIINPLSVTINGQTYLDQEEMDSETFLSLIAGGGLPVSSQPSIGNTLELYQQYAGEEILNITMADGLSGTYQSALGALETMETANENIYVINSKTLWAPQGYLVRKALALAAENLSATEIIERLRPSIERSTAILIPSDFDFLRRGGRLAPFAASVGQVLKLVPVMRQTKDGQRIEKYALCRNMKAAYQSAIKALQSFGIDANYLLTVSHAGAPHLAQAASDALRKAFPAIEVFVHPLSPAMITQGGPGCLAVQAILK